MSYRSLLVLLDKSPACHARVQMAMELAREHGCHLVGLAPTGLIDAPTAFGAATPFSDSAALTWNLMRDNAEDAAQCFRDECLSSRVPSFEAVVDEEDKAMSMVRHAHGSDLVIVTQAHPGEPGHRGEQAMVEQIVIHSARPTLVIPHSSHVAHIGRRILVAWDDSREAARALADALPLLAQASRVLLVCWNEPDSARQRARMEVVQHWLHRHGPAAGIQVEEETPSDLAGAMQAQAIRMEADLIVMGAYGRSRWTERILGSATRGMLNSMTVPVLMSH